MDPVAEARAGLGELVKWRRDLHRIPEVGFNLGQTSRYLRDRLDEMGIPYRVAARTGIVALIAGGAPGPILALRADMDALPVREETGLPFASTNGNMHACGHDAHMAILLQSARIISAVRGSLKGGVKLIFQPGEEGHGGAAQMIADGCLENPSVDWVTGLHVGQVFSEVNTGQIGISAGPIMASSTAFTVTVEGRGTHGAMPHLGVDPVPVAAEIILALQRIVSREVDPLQTAVLTIGRIEGGDACNVIPSRVSLSGDFRAVDEEVREFIARRAENICRHIAAANRAEALFEITGAYPPTINDPACAEAVRRAALEVVGANNVVCITRPSMVTEDVSLYFRGRAGAYFMLGTGNAEKGIVYPHHNSRFDVDEEVLWAGSAIFSRLVLNILG